MLPQYVEYQSQINQILSLLLFLTLKCIMDNHRYLQIGKSSVLTFLIQSSSALQHCCMPDHQNFTTLHGLPSTFGVCSSLEDIRKQRRKCQCWHRKRDFSEDIDNESFFLPLSPASLNRTFTSAPIIRTISAISVFDSFHPVKTSYSLNSTSEYEAGIQWLPVKRGNCTLVLSAMTTVSVVG